MKNTTRILIALFFVLISFGAEAQDSKFHSAYLYQFGRIMNWPALEDEFVIAVWGDSDIIPLVEKVASIKKVKEKTIVVRKVTNINQLSGSNIVFVPADGVSALGKITATIRNQGVLVVSEKKGTTRNGAGISFIKVNGKMLFELHKANIAAGGLKSTLALERIAHKVY
ncbi:MAG: YfiR family protein [Bacteroidota bacterium]